MDGPDSPASPRPDNGDSASDGHTDYDEEQTVEDATLPLKNEDVVAHHTKLSAKERDMLRKVFVLNQEEDTTTTGVRIEEYMKAEYGIDVSSTYRIADRLIDKDLVLKRPHTQNGSMRVFQITQDGIRCLTDLATLVVQDLEPIIEQVSE